MLSFIDFPRILHTHFLISGKVLIATHALSYLDVCMEAAMVKDWLVTVMTKTNGKAACVIFVRVQVLIL